MSASDHSRTDETGADAADAEMGAGADARVSRRGGGRLWLKLLSAILLAGAFAVLIALGTWQVERLHWKEALLARIDARIDGPAAPLAEILALAGEDDAIEYRPTEATGRFDHGGTSYFFTTYEGRTGWDVMTPLVLSEPASLAGDVVMINRGFVPYDYRDPATRPDTEPVGLVTIDGLAREPIGEKPLMAPENKPAEHSFFWKDYASMAEAAGHDGRRLIPFAIDAGRPGQGDPRRLPIAGTTNVDLPNSHLGYAVTWYGLAATLVGVVVVYLFRARFRPGDADRVDLR